MRSQTESKKGGREKWENKGCQLTCCLGQGKYLQANFFVSQTEYFSHTHHTILIAFSFPNCIPFLSKSSNEGNQDGRQQC